MSEYKTTAIVSSKTWGPDDDYLVIELQVPEYPYPPAKVSFRDGEEVEVIVRKK